MAKLNEGPVEGPRKTVDDPTPPDGGHPENREGAEKATKDNDLTTGHSEAGDGGDANSKHKAGE